MLISRASRRSGAAAGPITPLATELNPDVGLDAQALSWTAIRFNPLGSSYSITAPGLSGSLTLNGTNAAVNTTGNTFSPGTYRMQMTIVNWVAGAGITAAQIGTGEYQANFPSITGNGVYFADIVVTAQSVGKTLKLTAGSAANWEVTDISLKRIA